MMMTEFVESILIEAPPEKVWLVLADIGNIADWNPGVVQSKKTTPGEVKVGSCRRCNLGGKNYLNERVISFEPTRTMTIRVTETNLPFAHADIRFALVTQEEGTLVTVSPQYQLKYGALGRILDWFMVRRQYRKGMRGLLHGLKKYVENPPISLSWGEGFSWGDKLPRLPLTLLANSLS